MRADIYSRIEDLVDEMRGDWRKFFESDAFEEFVRHYIHNLISGVYDSLRLQGAQIAPSLLETEMKKFKFERVYDPSEDVTTCMSTDEQFVICINGTNVQIDKLKTIDEKFEYVIGNIVHEVGHRLFTDFTVLQAQTYQMKQAARFFPYDPKNYAGTTEGILLQQKLQQDEAYRKTFCKILESIQNRIEDGYIEQEMKSFYPGLASSYLGFMNELWFNEQPSMTDCINNQNCSALKTVLVQWLNYSVATTLKVGEKPIEDFDSAITDCIWNGMDLIDEARVERDPLKRADIENQLAVMLSPLLDKEIDDQKKKQKGSQQQKNQKANQSVQDMVNNLMPPSSNHGNSGNNSKSMTDPNRAQNSGLSKRQQQNQGGPIQAGSQQAGSNQASGGGNAGGSGPSTLDHSAAIRDLQNTLENAAAEKVTAQMEKERKQEMQNEAKTLMQGTGYAAPTIHRAESVAETNKQVYRELASRSVAIAKRMARLLKKHLQDSEVEAYTPWQYSGRKFVAKQYCRNELKGFARKQLPSPTTRCRVYALVDESGSVTQPLSDAEMKTCIILEQFCQDLQVPLTIQGYTSSGGELNIYSYVEEKRIDGDDKYRLTGMRARGGTPTANAMCYAIKRLEMNDKKENKILFVITDGGASDDSDGSQTKALIENAKKNNIRVVGCGIGADKNEVKAEFGDDNYLGIDNLEEMPERLLEIIRRKIYSHR